VVDSGPTAKPYSVEIVAISELKPHPKNYRAHPADQLDHIAASIQQHGFYRNVVTARDGTILAGHGVVEAAMKAGIYHVPVIRLDLDPDETRALKVLTGDNEISKLAEVDDRALTEMLKRIKEEDEAGLLGTGLDEQTLAALVFVTRPESEVADKDAAKEWVGLPEYKGEPGAEKLILNFKTHDEKLRCFALLGLDPTDSPRGVWWPKRERDDLASVRLEEAEQAP